MSHCHKIPFWTAVLMSINIIIGGGIFAGPQPMTLLSGSMSFISWSIAAVIVFPIVWGIARASVLFPKTGGFYNYCKNGLNEYCGFFAHWFYLLGYTMGTSSSIITLLRNNLSTRPWFSFFLNYPLTANALILIFFSLLNLMSLRVISRIQAFATILKLLPIVIVLLFMFWNSNYDIQYNILDLKKIYLTVPIVIFGFLGFESCCSLSHLLKSGPSSVSRVILTAFFITTCLYTLFHFGLLRIMGISNLSTEGTTAFVNYLHLPPAVLSIISSIITWSIMLSYANSLFGISLGNITNIIALSDLKKSHVIVIHGVVIWTLLCFMSNIQHLFAFTVLGVGAAYFLTLLAVANVSFSKREFLSVIVLFFGLLSCIALFYCCLADLGIDMKSRLVNLSPLLIAVIFGFIGYELNLIKIKNI